jgi:hypothetical protein
MVRHPRLRPRPPHPPRPRSLPRTRRPARNPPRPLLNTQFRAAAGLTPNPDSEPSSDAASAHESHGWGVNGRYTADLVPLAKIDLEDQLQLNTGNNTTTVIARPGAFAKIHWWEGPSATKINHDGVIGNGLLDRFTWTIDSAAKRIYAAPATGN